MTTIKIKIDCDGEYCGDCDRISIDDIRDSHCLIFDESLEYLKAEKGCELARCSACLSSVIGDTDD